MKPPKIRTIIDQPRVEQLLGELGVSAHRIDDVMRGLGDTIARKPEVFEREEITGWSRIIVKGFPPDIAYLRIWFTYNENEIMIEFVEPLD